MTDPGHALHRERPRQVVAGGAVLVPLAHNAADPPFNGDHS